MDEMDVAVKVKNGEVTLTGGGWIGRARLTNSMY
jgi:hypothetical protein